MTRRKRLIAGTFALVAMTLSLGETVWAATCGPEDMVMAASEGAPEAPAEPDCMPSMACDGHQPDGGDDERSCPFGPAATLQGCAGAASLPAHVAEASASSPENAVRIFTEEMGRDLLSADTPFHPPRS